MQCLSYIADVFLHSRVFKSKFSKERLSKNVNTFLKCKDFHEKMINFRARKRAKHGRLTLSRLGL